MIWTRTPLDLGSPAKPQFVSPSSVGAVLAALGYAGATSVKAGPRLIVAGKLQAVEHEGRILVAVDEIEALVAREKAPAEGARP